MRSTVAWIDGADQVPDWESIKGLGVIAGMALGFLVGGRIIYWLIELIKTRDKNQMDRDDKRDTLLLNLQISVMTLDKLIHDNSERQRQRDQELNDHWREIARTAVYRQADKEREEGRP